MDNLTAIIPFRNGHATLGRLLDSLPKDLRILVVDDLSDPPYQPDPFGAFKDGRQWLVALGLQERGYFAGAVNAGIKACTTDVLVLNQDVWLEGDAWQELVQRWQSEHVAIAGSGVSGHPAWPQGYVQGQFMFLGRAAIERVGMLNARDYPLWGNTCEWQLRACRLGLQAEPTDVPGFHHERQGGYGESIRQALRDELQKEKLLLRTPPAISVVIVSHMQPGHSRGYGRFIPDAVHSLVGGATCLGAMPGQTFQSFEVVIVDAGTTDETAEVGRQLADPWKGIRYLRVEAQGTAAACNAGVRAAHGQYVTLLDADDLMEPARLETLYRVAEQNPHAVIYDDLMVVQHGKRTERWPMPEYDFDRLLTKNPMHKGILFPRAAWNETGGYPEVMREGREDWAFNLALGVKGWCGVHVAEPLYLYRREGQNRSTTNAGAAWRERFMSQLVSLFPQIYAGERPMACCGRGAQKVSSGGRARGAFTAQNLPGEQGMVMLQYQLSVAGSKTYYGPATGQTYVFGGQRKIGYVDARDVDGMLDLWEGRTRPFERYVAPVQAESIAANLVPPSDTASGDVASKMFGAGEVAGQLIAQSRPPMTSGVESALRELGVKPLSERTTEQEQKTFMADIGNALHDLSATNPARAQELSVFLLSPEATAPAKPKRRRGKT